MMSQKMLPVIPGECFWALGTVRDWGFLLEISKDKRTKQTP